MPDEAPSVDALMEFADWIRSSRRPYRMGSPTRVAFNEAVRALEMLAGELAKNETMAVRLAHVVAGAAHGAGQEARCGGSEVAPRDHERQ